MQALFGAKPDPKEAVKKWKQQMRGESRKVDRQIRGAPRASPRAGRAPSTRAPPPRRAAPRLRANRPRAQNLLHSAATSSRHMRPHILLAGIQKEEAKVKASIKQASKRGDLSNARTLAKEIVRSRKAVNRLHASKAQMNSIVMQMENQLAQQKVTGHMAKSAEVMKGMNRLVKISDISATMQEMQKEMTKAGVIEEMVDGAFEVLDEEEDEDAADEEVERVMTELAADAMGGAQRAPTKAPVVAAAAAADEEDEEDMVAMRERLAQLKSAA